MTFNTFDRLAHSRSPAFAAPAPSGITTGAAAIGMAIFFNLPYSVLAVTYDYPAILRRTAGEALDKFAAGGPALVLTWYAFMIAALALVPLAIALAVTPERLSRWPALTLGALTAGTLAGLAQAIGLTRWVFVVPALAATHADPAVSAAARALAEDAFGVLNSYGGVAIGEHLGQWLTAMFVMAMAILQWRESERITSGIGAFTAAAIALGTGEGLAMALHQSGEMFSMATIGGFLGLSLWLVTTGIGLIRNAMLKPSFK